MHDVLILIDGTVKLHERTIRPRPSGREMYFNVGNDGLDKFRLAFDPGTVHGVQVWCQV